MKLHQLQLTEEEKKLVELALIFAAQQNPVDSGTPVLWDIINGIRSFKYVILSTHD